MEKKTKINVWYIVAAMLGIMMLQNMWSQSKQVEVIPYSEVQRYLEAEQVQEMVVTETHVYGVFKLPLADGKREFSPTESASSRPSVSIPSSQRIWRSTTSRCQEGQSRRFSNSCLAGCCRR
jgi:hypothetical protein